MSDTSSTPPSPVSTPPSSLPSPELAALSLADVSEENKAEAAKIKTKANQAFVGQFALYGRVSSPPDFCLGHDFNLAVDLYTQAIELNPTDATLWCNLAYTRIKLEEYGYALSDAGRSFSY
jgi:serine/threonine-protein phosphatase 5